MVFSAAVTLRSYFGVFGDIARMWVQLSKDNIFPGLKMCDELSVTSEDPAQMKRKVAELDMWSRDAAQRISQLAREVNITYHIVPPCVLTCCYRNRSRSIPGWRRRLER
jgi:hypothetical protein